MTNPKADPLREALAACREYLVEVTKPPRVGSFVGVVSSYHPCHALIDKIDAALASQPAAAPVGGREEIAEAIWRAEIRRAMGKERDASWADGLNDRDKDNYRYIADAILAITTECCRGLAPISECQCAKDTDARLSTPPVVAGADRAAVALALINETRTFHGLDAIDWDFPALSTPNKERALRQADAVIRAFVDAKGADRAAVIEELYGALHELTCAAASMWLHSPASKHREQMSRASFRARRALVDAGKVGEGK